MSQIQAVVLAAGKGTRIGAKDKPKVMFPLNHRPIISYVIDNLRQAGFKKPLVVIGFRGKLIQNYLQNKAQFVWQRRQLGTAHAVLQTQNALKPYDDVLIVLGDMPFWQPETLKKIITLHRKSKATLSLVSVTFDNPSFFAYGRIVRNAKGDLEKIVEEKEATPQEKQIKECNPSCYVVRTAWLFNNLAKIAKTSGEYYLTDILALAIAQRVKIAVLPITDWQQAIGINTKEHLALAEKVLKSFSK